MARKALKDFDIPTPLLKCSRHWDEIRRCDVTRHVPRPRKYHGSHTQRNAPEPEHPLKITNEVFKVFVDREDNPFTDLLREILIKRRGDEDYVDRNGVLQVACVALVGG